MSIGVVLWVGRFDFTGDPWLRALDRDEVAAVFADYADRDPDGSFPATRASRDGRYTGLGWCGGVPVSFERSGYVTTQVGPWDASRMFPFLARMVTEMGCVVYAPDHGGDWTGVVMQQVTQRARAEPGAAADGPRL